MKTSVCFSGFSADEAQALRAEAGKMESLWEYRFESEVATTRSSLAGQPCDALVVNMSAQAIGAVDLLRGATSLNPAPLRFIVGGVDDQSVVINSIGGSHHFIRRPFEPADLIKNIQRGLKLDTWLSTAELRALAPRLRRLPSLPATYFNLLKEIESPAATLQGIANVIARDPAVALGLSPRAGVHLVRALRTWALLQGRDYVIAQDFRDLALDVWAHRLELRDAVHDPRVFLESIVAEEMIRHEG